MVLEVLCLCVYLLGVIQGREIQHEHENRDDVAATLTQILQQGIEDSTYPAVVAIVGNTKEILYSNALGHLTYSVEDTATTLDTHFDLASLTKVFATTSAVALLYEQGYLSVQDKVSQYLGTDFNVHGKDLITIENCLLHNAGFSPDPDPCYWYPEFECPNTDDEYPAEDFSCLDKVWVSLMGEQLNTPPGEYEVYSDLSFITLQMVVGTIALDNNLISPNDYLPQCQSRILNSTSKKNQSQNVLSVVCAFEAFVRTKVFHRPTGPDKEPWLKTSSYLPSPELYHLCAPTMDDTGEGSYTHRRLQGQVADGNCYAMGGIAGHAGVFSTAPDVGKFLQYMLSTLEGTAQHDSSHFINSSTIELFTTIKNVSQSSRAYGWTTNSFRDSENADHGYDHSCGSMSGKTFMHIGYTGTCMCADPKSSLWSVILTNRAYNCQGQKCPTELSTAVKSVYRKFNTVVSHSFSLSN